MPAKIPKRRQKPAQRQRHPKRSPRATVATVHHPEGVHPLQGSEERAAMLRRRAMQLKSWGLNVPQIVPKLVEEFELAGAPATRTVHNWINEAYQEAWDDEKDLARRHALVILDRTELMIASLLPVATGRCIIARTRMRQGLRVEVLDEHAVNEQIKAAETVRRLLETQGKVLGIVKQENTAGGDSVKNAGGITNLVLTTIQQNLILPGAQIPAGKTSEQVLELSAGDSIVDGM